MLSCRAAAIARSTCFIVSFTASPYARSTSCVMLKSRCLLAPDWCCTRRLRPRRVRDQITDPVNLIFKLHQVVGRDLVDLALRLGPAEPVSWRQLNEVGLAHNLVPFALRVDHRRREQPHRQRPGKRVRLVEMLQLQQRGLVHQPQSLGHSAAGRSVRGSGRPARAVLRPPTALLCLSLAGRLDSSAGRSRSSASHASIRSP